MSTKIRVRDLATELDISSKDLMVLLRELDIQAKSHMSGLTDEEANQVREQHRDKAAAPQTVETRPASGIIVRRRRTPKPAKDGQPTAPTPADTDSPEDQEDALEATPDVKKTDPPAPSRKATLISTPAARIIKPKPQAEPAEPGMPKEEPVQEHVEAAPVEVTEEKTPAEASPLDQETAAVIPETLESKKTEAEPADVAQEVPTPEVVTTTEVAATKVTTPEVAATEEQPKARKKSKKSRPAPAPVQVKIISRPTIVEFPDTAPAASAAPSGTRPDRPASRFTRPAAPAETPRPAPEDGGGKDSRGKRKKGRRMVDAADLYRKEEFSLGKGKKALRAEARRAGSGRNLPQSTQPIKASKRKIRVEDTIRLTDLAHQMGIKAQDLIKKLFGLGVMATINQSLDFDTALVLAAEFQYEVEKIGFSEEEFLLPKEADKVEDLKPRPPVVTIMGHVDHGKTSLLDAIRSASVATGEAGGITQHIGAYHVNTPRGEVVFLDTPGHEAFTTMRARGAKVTDIVVLVVAADDGVMEQTREAVSHSKAANVPIVVAVNKMDKEEADPDRVKRELSDLGLMPEDWGGETIYAHVSAKKRQGLDELLELILLQAEVLDLKANPDKPGRGHIVEAKLDKGRGPVGTVLIQEGQISQGDAFVCGLISGKVRAMFDDQGHQIKTAGPAIPTEIQGFESVPEAGDEFVIVQDEKVARKIAADRRVKHRDRELAKESKVTLESFLASKAGEEAQTLSLLLKADVQGSLEAISEALVKLSTDEVKIVLVHGGAGAITESDILLASASNAIIIGFNIRPTAKIKEIAEQENVDIRFYDIIYKLVDDIKAAMSGMLAPDIKEEYLGQADVLQTFSVPKFGTIAGCMVSDGKLKRNAHIRLLRDGVVTYTGKLSSLKRFKDDAKEVTKGYECGAALENFNDIKVGDIIEAFELIEEARTI